MNALFEAARAAGFHKLVSRIFPENTASLRMTGALGFREVGVYGRHGQWMERAGCGDRRKTLVTARSGPVVRMAGGRLVTIPSYLVSQGK